MIKALRRQSYHGYALRNDISYDNKYCNTTWQLIKNTPRYSC